MLLEESDVLKHYKGVNADAVKVAGASKQLKDMMQMEGDARMSLSQRKRFVQACSSASMPEHLDDYTLLPAYLVALKLADPEATVHLFCLGERCLYRSSHGRHLHFWLGVGYPISTPRSPTPHQLPRATWHGPRPQPPAQRRPRLQTRSPTSRQHRRTRTVFSSGR